MGLNIDSPEVSNTSKLISYGAIHKGRPRRGWEGGFRNPDIGRGGGLIQKPGRPSLKKTRITKNILWNKMILTVK